MSIVSIIGVNTDNNDYDDISGHPNDGRVSPPEVAMIAWRGGEWCKIKGPQTLKVWKFEVWKCLLGRFESLRVWEFESLKVWKFESLKVWKLEIGHAPQIIDAPSVAP